ncbi:MAG: glycosyltransferase family 4 protein [Alphaproteobacteria bacterium]
MRLFLDITRIATRIIRATPTGIDRTEFAYAREILFNRPDIQTTPVLTTPWFSGAITAGLARKVLAQVETSWQAPSTVADDLAFARLLPELQSKPDTSRTQSARIQGRPPAQVVRQGIMFPIGELASATARLSTELASLKGTPAAYVHTSHTQLEHTRRFAWTQGKVKSVFFLHDVIPIDYPEYCSPGAAPRHLGRLKTVSELAELILVNSQYTADRTRHWLRHLGWREPRIDVVPLGVEDAFLTPQHGTLPPVERPYFVYVGTIEPRKNLAFLLAVWRQLAEQCGEATPRLLLVGRRGWENESVVDLLERSARLAPYVIEVSGLTDHGLMTLLRGSAGLVSPSYVEGFGLPLIEAAALGTPLIVSDIPAHREVASQGATFIDPNDGPAWIKALQHGATHPRTAIGNQHQPLRTWPQHVSEALASVRLLHTQPPG